MVLFPEVSNQPNEKDVNPLVPKKNMADIEPPLPEYHPTQGNSSKDTM